ncbi:MAG: hypothetical protein H8F28_18055 [Fibrella sp.]|nr:hypothetical protein [Armatimonadota bacterium]
MATMVTTDERIEHIEQMLQTFLEPTKDAKDVRARIDATFAEIDRVRESIATNRERARVLAEATKANFVQIDSVLAHLTVTK